MLGWDRPKGEMICMLGTTDPRSAVWNTPAPFRASPPTAVIASGVDWADSARRWAVTTMSAMPLWFVCSYAVCACWANAGVIAAEDSRAAKVVMLNE